MSTSSSHSPADHVADLRTRVDEALSALVDDCEPAVLYEPVRHVLTGSGKRVRPLLLILVAEAYERTVSSALPAALAVELFHNFTLVHDDIMDESNERRGRPTVHVKWDVGTAILVGDLLLGRSYQTLGQVEGTPIDQLYDVFHPMVEKLCTGQALDASFEAEGEVPVDTYLEMIDGKTAALLSACMELGGVIGGASSSDRGHLRSAGKLVGRAFQIQDDLLDVVADGEDWGKAVGGDLVNGKKTYVTLRALERAENDEYEWFSRLMHGGLPPGDVEEARERMDRLGVFEDARSAVQEYTDVARDHLRVLTEGPAQETILWLLSRMEARDH